MLTYIGTKLPGTTAYSDPDNPGMHANVVAQGDSDDIGCRIVVDGVVKAEKITHETSAFTFCSLKAS